MLENDVVHFVHNDVMFAIKNVPSGIHHMRSIFHTRSVFHIPQEYFTHSVGMNFIEKTLLV